jgi:hypothetical protein
MSMAAAKLLRPRETLTRRRPGKEKAEGDVPVMAHKIMLLFLPASER